MLEDLTLHVVVVVQEVHSVARLVLVAGALNVDVDEVTVVQKPVDDIIAAVVEVRLLTAHFEGKMKIENACRFSSAAADNSSSSSTAAGWFSHGSTTI